MHMFHMFDCGAYMPCGDAAILEQSIALFPLSPSMLKAEPDTASDGLATLPAMMHTPHSAKFTLSPDLCGFGWRFLTILTSTAVLQFPKNALTHRKAFLEDYVMTNKVKVGTGSFRPETRPRVALVTRVSFAAVLSCWQATSWGPARKGPAAPSGQLCGASGASIVAW